LPGRVWASTRQGEARPCARRPPPPAGGGRRPDVVVGRRPYRRGRSGARQQLGQRSRPTNPGPEARPGVEFGRNHGTGRVEERPGPVRSFLGPVGRGREHAPRSAHPPSSPPSRTGAAVSSPIPADLPPSRGRRHGVLPAGCGSLVTPGAGPKTRHPAGRRPDQAGGLSTGSTGRSLVEAGGRRRLRKTGPPPPVEPQNRIDVSAETPRATRGFPHQFRSGPGLGQEVVQVVPGRLAVIHGSRAGPPRSASQPVVRAGPPPGLPLPLFTGSGPTT